MNSAEYILEAVLRGDLVVADTMAGEYGVWIGRPDTRNHDGRHWSLLRPVSLALVNLKATRAC